MNISLTIEYGLNEMINDENTLLIREGRYFGTGNKNIELSGLGTKIIKNYNNENVIIDGENENHRFIKINSGMTIELQYMIYIT